MTRQKKIIKDLIKIVGKADVLIEKEDLASYSYDGTTTWVHEPDVVVSGEHGIGLEKRRFLMETIPPMALEIMQKIKRIGDSQNILNPGKIWEE